MADELDELISFLSSSSPNLRKTAVEIVEGLTGSDEGCNKLLTRIPKLLPALLGLLHENQVALPAARSLVNLSQDEDFSDKLVEVGAVPKLMELLGKRASQSLDRLLVMLLVNLTNLEQGAKDLLQETDDKLGGLFVSKLVRFFSRAADEGEDPYEHVGSILVNVTRLDTGRKLLLDEKRGLLKLVLHQSDSKSLVRRRGVIGTLRNCCFESESHLDSLLALADIIWPCLLLPVAGNKVYSEEETSKMPPELAVPLSIERQTEDDPQIRIEALEALYMLVMQDAGYRALWALNGTMILKLGYECEEDAKVMEKYEQVGSMIIGQGGGGGEI